MMVRNVGSEAEAHVPEVVAVSTGARATQELSSRDRDTDETKSAEPTRVQAIFEHLAAVLERRAWLVLGVFLLLGYLPLSIDQAHNTPLRHDEIFTVHIAQAANLREMLALRREIDLHPPLHYVLERVALKLPAPRWFSARLPNILAGLVALAALFGYTKRRLGPLAAFTAAVVFWFGPLPEFAWENRPYMLWYALLTLLMIAWSRATERSRSPFSLALVAALALLLSATHLFGLACLVPFLIAECVRSYRRYRWDWPLLMALAVPLPLAALAYFQVRHLGANSFPADQLPSVAKATGMYFNTVTSLFYVFGCSAIAWVLLASGAPVAEHGVQGRSTFAAPRGRLSGLQPEDYALLAGLIALPLALMAGGVLLQIQFWDRYGYFVALPAAVLIAKLFSRLFARQPGTFAVLCVVMLFAGAGARLLEGTESPNLKAAGEQSGLAPQELAKLNPALPIVAASPLTFIEMSDREPLAVARRTYYLTNHDAALRYSGYTLFDNEGKIRGLLGLPSQTASLDQFLAANPQFYMVATFTTEQEWLPRALVARGLVLRYLGKFVSTYDDSDLYLVVRSLPAAAIDAAGTPIQ